MGRGKSKTHPALPTLDIGCYHRQVTREASSSRKQAQIIVPAHYHVMSADISITAFAFLAGRGGATRHLTLGISLGFTHS